MYGIAGNNYNDGSGFVPTSLNPPANASDVAGEADSLLRALLVQDFPLAKGSQEVEQVLQLYPLTEFEDNHGRGAQIYQDVIFGW
jgi:hypothetical protein